MSKYEVPGGRLFLFAWVVRKRWACVRQATHPPAPSQREGERLFVNGLIGEAKCRKKNLREKDPPFPLGRGRGMGSKPNAHGALAHDPLPIKG
jgi:hypothetical protein